MKYPSRESNSGTSVCSTQVKFWPSFESVSSNLPNPQSPTTPRDLNQQWGQTLQGLKRLGNTGRTVVRFAVKIKRVASGGTEVSPILSGREYFGDTKVEGATSV